MMAAINTTKPAPAAAAARGKEKGATATMDSPAAPHDSKGTSTGSNNVYQSALDTLAPLEPMLAGFARRNKNQHRRARWWASFSMLRRGASKLLIELVAAARSRAARHLITTADSAPIVAGGGGGGGISKKSKKSSSSLSGQYEDQHLLDAADQRAAWLRDAIAPKCWIQFSQLTADPQFAGLGVVLLGSLAQVDQVCCALVGQRPIPRVAKAGVQATAAGVKGTTRFGVDDYHGGESGGGGGQRKTDGSRMLPEADEGRKIARPAALSTDDIAGRAITRTSMVPSRGGGGESGGGGFLKREEATARSDSKGKTTGSLPSSGQISPPSSLSMPPSIRQDKESGNQHDESNQEQESNDSTMHKALKRKRDALRTSVPLMVPTMSSNPMMVGHNKQGQDNKDNSGAVNRDELEVDMILRDSASSPEPSQQEHTPFAASPRARKPKQEEQGEHTTGVQIGDDPPLKKKPKKTMDSEEDIGNGDKQKKKKKKKKKKGGGDEFDSLFSSLF